MKASFFIVVLFLAVKISAQTKMTSATEDFISFHENISSAERMFKNDSLLQAYAKFDIAISNYKGSVNPTHYFDAAICALKIKEEFKALHFLEKAILNGFVIDSAKKAAVVFFNQNTRKEYADNIVKWETTRDASRNKAFENEIISLNETSKNM